jgi:hypothetical protein
MDHHEQHHEHHRKEREEEKKHRKEHERQEERQLRTIHPAWFVVAGVVLVVAVILVWTFWWV